MTYDINKEWEEFLAKAYPYGTVPEQLRQIRKCWYAGALAAMVLHLRISDEIQDQEKAAAEMRRLWDQTKHAIEGMIKP